MALDRTRTLRGALAGAAAAGVWAAQQPLDKRVFGVPYDDAELLGHRGGPRARRRSRSGSRIHLLNGAAVRRRVRQRRRRPCRSRRGLRGPLAGLAEHLATWPRPRSWTACTRRATISPTLGGRAAFSQAAWRHLLFGAVLGELERRLNPPEPEVPPIDAAAAASNGHGSRRARSLAASASAALGRASSSPARPGFAGRHLADACAAAGDERRRRSRAPRALDLRDAAATRAAGRASPAGRRLPPRRRAHVGRVVAGPARDAHRERGDDPRRCSRPCARRRPTRVVVAVGSGEVYGPPATLPVTEGAPLRPQNPYAVSKAAAELLAGFYADAHGLRVIHARAFNHAGPGQAPIFAIASFARQVAEGLEARRRPGPRGHGQPRRAPRLHRRA